MKDKEQEVKTNPLLAIKKAIKSKYRLVAGALASVAAIGIIGGSVHRLNESTELLEEPKDSIERYDSEYSKRLVDIENKISYIDTISDDEALDTTVSALDSSIKDDITPIDVSSYVNHSTIATLVPSSDIVEEKNINSMSVTNSLGIPTQGLVELVKLNKEFTRPRVSYSTTKLTNEDVVVTITADEEVQEIEGWNLSDDKMVLTKTYDHNVFEIVKVQDLDGNQRHVLIFVHNIDKTFEKVTVDYKVLSNGNVRVTIMGNEILQPLKGWVLSKDKKSLTRTYNYNKTETITVKDLAGNVQKVDIKVTNVHNYSNNDNYNPGNPSETIPSVPIVPTPEHTHEWGEWTITTPAGCETNGVETRTCQDGHTETREIPALGHNWKEGVVLQAPTETEDGVMSYSCLNCNTTKTESISALGHTHEWGEWTITIPAGCETSGVETRTCQGGHTETREIPAIGHNIQTTINADGTVTESCLNGCGYTNTTGTPKPVEPIEIDMSSLSVDENTFVYDGKTHLPVISGLPEGVTARFVFLDKDGNEISDVSNAGDYTCRIEFDTPEGYIANPLEIDYTIKPATINCSYEYNETTGELSAVYKGVIDTDIEKISHKVNGEDIADVSTVLDEYGLHKIESSIEINPDKVGNYVLTDNDSETAIYEVKRENQWFKIDTEYQEVDGKIVVQVYLSDDKVPYYSDYVAPSLDFKVYFDKDSLEYEDSTVNSDVWDGAVYIDDDKDPDAKDVVVSAALDDNGDSLFNAPVTDRVKVCELTFTYKDGHENDKNIIVKIDDLEMSTGQYDYDFTFTSDSSSCVINATGETTVITKENDLMDDATHNMIEQEGFEEEIEEGKGLLQDYIDSGFEVPDELKYLFGEPDEELEEESIYESDEIIPSVGEDMLEGEYVTSDTLEQGDYLDVSDISDTLDEVPREIDAFESMSIGEETYDVSYDAESDDYVAEQEGTQYSTDQEDGYSLTLSLY